VPGWRRFLEQYRSYMQIILLIAVVVSLAIGQWSTGAVLALLTVVNALARVGSSACRRTRPTCTASTQRVIGNRADRSGVAGPDAPRAGVGP